MLFMPAVQCVCLLGAAPRVRGTVVHAADGRRRRRGLLLALVLGPVGDPAAPLLPAAAAVLRVVRTSDALAAEREELT